MYTQCQINGIYSPIREYEQVSSYSDLSLNYMLNREYLPMPDLKISKQLLENDKQREQSLFDALFSGKLDLTRGTLMQTIELIQARRYIEQKNLYEIDKEICDCHSLQMFFDMLKVPKYEKGRINLEGMASNLENQKRMERSACWRDIMKLKLDIINIIGAYKSALAKQKMLSNESDFIPEETSSIEYGK